MIPSVSLLTWANAPFVTALGVVVVFALLQFSGVLALIAGDGGDGDANETESLASTAANGASDADADSDADSASDTGSLPVSIVWQSFASIFGATGVALNTVYGAATGHVATITLAWTVPIAIVVAFFATRALSRALGPLMSGVAERATSRRDLVGQLGVVISTRVDAEFGEVRIADKSGHAVRVIVRSREGEIAAGAAVVVVDCDDATGRLCVSPLDDVRALSTAP